MLSTPLSGVGEEAYRARVGGGLIARAGEHVLLIAPHVPHVAPDERDRASAALARDTIALKVSG